MWIHFCVIERINKKSIYIYEQLNIKNDFLKTISKTPDGSFLYKTLRDMYN